jgi:aspartyl-tRNA(Asn)/glutamyl-tRNA(Gln) amidotransferase subunit C
MEISDELIDALAELARIEIPSDQIPVIREDLRKMISFVRKLEELDTEHVHPALSMSDAENNFREDAVNGEISRAEALMNAPVSDAEFFLVPKVIQK